MEHGCFYMEEILEITHDNYLVAHLHFPSTHKARQKMQKSYQANAQATLGRWTQTRIVDDREEGRTYNRGFGVIGA